MIKALSYFCLILKMLNSALLADSKRKDDELVDARSKNIISQDYNLLTDNTDVVWTNNNVMLKRPSGLSNPNKVSLRAFTTDLLPYTNSSLPTINCELKVKCDYDSNYNTKSFMFSGTPDNITNIYKNLTLSFPDRYHSTNSSIIDDTIYKMSKQWTYDSNNESQLNHNIDETLSILNTQFSKWLGYGNKTLYALNKTTQTSLYQLDINSLTSDYMNLKQFMIYPKYFVKSATNMVYINREGYGMCIPNWFTTTDKYLIYYPIFSINEPDISGDNTKIIDTDNEEILCMCCNPTYSIGVIQIRNKNTGDITVYVMTNKANRSLASTYTDNNRYTITYKGWYNKFGLPYIPFIISTRMMVISPVHTSFSDTNGNIWFVKLSSDDATLSDTQFFGKPSWLLQFEQYDTELLLVSNMLIVDSNQCYLTFAYAINDITYGLRTMLINTTSGFTGSLNLTGPNIVNFYDEIYKPKALFYGLGYCHVANLAPIAANWDNNKSTLIRSDNEYMIYSGDDSAGETIALFVNCMRTISLFKNSTVNSYRVLQLTSGIDNDIENLFQRTDYSPAYIQTGIKGKGAYEAMKQNKTTFTTTDNIYTESIGHYYIQNPIECASSINSDTYTTTGFVLACNIIYTDNFNNPGNTDNMFITNAIETKTLSLWASSQISSSTPTNQIINQADGLVTFEQYDGVFFKYDSVNKIIHYPCVTLSNTASSTTTYYKFCFIPYIYTSPYIFDITYIPIYNMSDTYSMTDTQSDVNISSVGENTLDKLEAISILNNEYNDLTLRIFQFPNNDNVVFSANDKSLIRFKYMDIDNTIDYLQCQITDYNGNVVDNSMLKGLYGKVIISVDWEQ